MLKERMIPWIVWTDPSINAIRTGGNVQITGYKKKKHNVMHNAGVLQIQACKPHHQVYLCYNFLMQRATRK